MAHIEELTELLNQDILQLKSLSDVLEREKALLSDSDVKSLTSVTEEKNLLLNQIRERAKSKIRVLVAMGFRPDQGQPSRFIAAAGLTSVEELWSEADELLNRCQSLNRLNGRVISHLQKRLSKLTEIFRGASGQEKLYGAKGQEQSVSHTSVLASA